MNLKVTNAANHGPTSLKRLILWCLLQNRNSNIIKFTPTKRRVSKLSYYHSTTKILDKDLQSKVARAIMFLPKQTVPSTDKAGIKKNIQIWKSFYKLSSRSSKIIRSNGGKWFYRPPLRLLYVFKNVKWTWPIAILNSSLVNNSYMFRTF